MVKKITNKEYGGEGVSPWTRVNRAEDNPPNQVYTRENPPEYMPNVGERSARDNLIVDLVKEMAEMPPLGENP